MTTAKIKTRVVLEIEVPEGAIYFDGNLANSPGWYKQVPSAKFPNCFVWFYWNRQNEKWNECMYAPKTQNLSLLSTYLYSRLVPE